MILLVVLCAVWGAQQITIKLALPGISPLMQASLRSFIAVAMVWVWMRMRGIPLLVPDGAWRPGLLSGILFAIEFWFIYGGLQYTTASHLVVFLYTTPFLIALGVHFLLPGERLVPAQVAGMLLAFGGIVVIFGEGLLQPPLPTAWLGDIMGFMGAVFWALTTLVVRLSKLVTIPPARNLFYQLAVSALLLLLASVLTGEPGIIRITPAIAGYMLFQGVIVAFASYLAWFWLIAHYPVPLVASCTFMTPLFGVLLGVLLLSEPFTLPLLAGAVLVGAGIFLVNRKRPVL